MIGSDVSVKENDKSKKAFCNFRDLTDGIWSLVTDGGPGSIQEAVAVVFDKRGSDLEEDDQELDTYDRYPKVLICLTSSPLKSQAFIPNHDCWANTKWIKYDATISVTFSNED